MLFLLYFKRGINNKNINNIDITLTFTFSDIHINLITNKWRNLDIVSPIPINYICFSIYVLVSICWHKQHLCSVISYSCHTCCWTLTKQKILSQIRWSDVGHSVTDMMNVKIPRPTNRFPMSETQHNFFSEM